MLVGLHAGIGRAFCGGIPSDDCEQVARVILGADMNMRQSFKPKVELVTGMLAIDFEIEKEGMTVPYPQLFNDIGRNHGFVDLRGRPDLAIEIPEGSQSPATANLLRPLNWEMRASSTT